MANKNFEVTITLTMKIDAPTREEAEETARWLVHGASGGIQDSPWRPPPEDIEAPEVSVEEV